MANHLRDRSGERIGRLTVLAYTGKRTNSGHNAIWLCKCDCGNLIERSSGHLSGKGTQSCGCFARDRMAKLNLKHGGRGDKLYLVWMDMRRRCRDEKDKNYMNYGGRGIRVCDAWEDYEAFKDWAYSNGYDETASYRTCTIDRIDVNGDYSPENCRWVDSKTQCNNKRNNRLIEFGGRVQTIAEWARELDLSYGMILKRLDAGWSPEDAFCKPPRVTKRFPAGNRLK